MTELKIVVMPVQRPARFDLPEPVVYDLDWKLHVDEGQTGFSVRLSPEDVRTLADVSKIPIYFQNEGQQILLE